MEVIGVREFKDHASQILRKVREERVEYQVTYHGKVIARLVPAESFPIASNDTEAVWADLDELAEEIARAWPQGVSAVDAVREVRRE